MHIDRSMTILVYILPLLAACTGHIPSPNLSNTNLETGPSKTHTLQMQVWEKESGVPFFTGMGQHHHTISTNHPGTQHYFNQGLVLSFAYNHTESVRAFRAAQKLDERCAMCYWGEALALGPNINVTHQGRVIMRDEARIQAYTAIQKAIALKQHASPHEQDYINALAKRYNGNLSINRDGLDQAYMSAMRDLSQKYPQDDTAAALYAESMMNLMPWDYWIDPDTPKILTTEVITVLETLLERSPRHPLGIHLYIHAVESSSKPERAEAAADKLLDLVPGAGHLVHMPSHIYWRVGRYHDAAKANIKAAIVDEKYIATHNAQGFYPVAYYPHNLHFLWAAYSMEGRSLEAIKTAHKVAESISDELITDFPMVELYKTIPILTLTDFGQWQNILAVPQPPANRPYSNAIWHYARALAHIRLKNIAAARTEQVNLALLQKNPGIAALDTLDYPASSLLHIADQLIFGELLMAEGKQSEAITALNNAVTIQDSLPYMEPPFWYYPTRHMLGKVLLDIGRFEQAEKVYRENLKNYPKNGWGLYGLKRSLDAQGKPSDDIKKAFIEAWQHADIILPASRF